MVKHAAPEWNDANNALVGQGISMVTLYYMRRYVRFLLTLISEETNSLSMSQEVVTWLMTTSDLLQQASEDISSNTVDKVKQRQLTEQLGDLSSWYRQTVYKQQGFSESHSEHC